MYRSNNYMKKYVVNGIINTIGNKPEYCQCISKTADRYRKKAEFETGLPPLLSFSTNYSSSSHPSG